MIDTTNELLLVILTATFCLGTLIFIAAVCVIAVRRDRQPKRGRKAEW